MEWDTANRGVTLQDSQRNLEDLSGLQALIFMGGPYYPRMTLRSKPFFEPTVRVTERGREYHVSMGLARSKDLEHGPQPLPSLERS